MVHFSKLKLYGFKSFVDKTELDIGPGLNGIVGPNGCGKSNLVEALRWVMGEKSAKNMRGGGMEDVIFAGTSKRPARNMAQAAIIIDNQDGNAPAPFNTASEIEISRHIERDKGSQYRVNGKAVRARDVNLLFADTMTGANSPALVSQGRITEIIVAKPQDRRRILEESAGISGLHSRRHEAELRLRAADQNLIRLNDAMNDMRSRLTSLKRQARQAERYKQLNNEIRKTDIALSWLEWRDTHQKIREERTVFKTENDIVQTNLQRLKDLEANVLSTDKTLPDLRKQDMEARAVLQNFRVSMARLDEDEKAKAQGLKDAQIRQTQLNQDLDFTKEKFESALGIIEQSNLDMGALESQLLNLPSQIAIAEKKDAEQKGLFESYAQQKVELDKQIAIAVDGYDTLAKQHEDVTKRLAQEQSKIDAIKEAIDTAQHDKRLIDEDVNALPDITKLSTDIETFKSDIDLLEETLIQQGEHLDEATSLYNQSIQDLNVIEAEYNALSDLISRRNNDNDMDTLDLLMDHLNVRAGYEKAVSNTLGHWVAMAGMDNSADVYWHDVTCASTPPNGYAPLSDYLDAPKSLKVFFDSIGVCDTLPTTLPQLNIGQTLVARDGGMVRWDGLIVKSSASNDQTDMASLLFEQRNRLDELQKLKEAKKSEVQNNTAAKDSAARSLEITKIKSETLNEQLSTAKSTLVTAQHGYERLTDKQNTIAGQLTQKEIDFKDAQTNLNELLTLSENLSNQLSKNDQKTIEEKRKKFDLLDEKLSELQTVINENNTHLIQLKYESDDIARQKNTLKNQIETAQLDRDTYNTRIESLVERLDIVDAQIKGYTDTQNENDTDSMRESILSKISNQQTIVDEIAIKLEQEETRYKTIQNDLRSTESMTATAREKRALAQANVSNAEQEMARIEAHIKDKFELSPQSLEEQTLSLFEHGLPHKDVIIQQRDDSIKGRDAIGPVNLRATVESDETESQLATMETEHNDLTKAIAQLRGGITKLNREARERLAIAFKRVDAHFQKLFNQLFTGGKAYLEMIESEDPLESGLEIYAQPPGKALQKLSLLSGGEQTLTATALIFAMFMTNPSPICVLDEIDAPLDDANVDRVCSLMENIARDTQTRFIVITHHRMTMARMDRLYGVTMSERGVSQLVSVDMAMQDELSLNETA